MNQVNEMAQGYKIRSEWSLLLWKQKLQKEVRFLKIYAVVTTLFCAIFLLSAFVMQGKKQKFEEIDVERINIVERTAS